jgi:chromosome transmission fidelity protein 4
MITDYYGFTMGALGEHGCAFASAGSRSTGGSRSTVLYKPFQSWVPNAEWTHQLPEGEEACGLVVAGAMVAVTTSAHLLRLFTASGLQVSVIFLIAEFRTA